MTSVLRIALTGGIGSGKTTIANKFEQLGVPVIDADIIARDLVQPEQACLKKVLESFDVELLTETGQLDREKLRKIIFDDNTAKEKLEKILHPAIQKQIRKKIAQIDFPYCLTVIPLLIETNATAQFDRTLVIDVDKSTQIERACQRDNTSKENIKKIINTQVSRETRLKYADDVIKNEFDITLLDSAVDNLHKKYLSLSDYRMPRYT